MIVTIAMSLIALMGPPGRSAPGLDVALLLDKTAITPGTSAELAVVIDVDRPWHVYYPIVLDTGFGTTIDFDLPPGLRVDNVRFPQPALDETAGIEYLALEGKFTVLATVHADASLRPGSTASITARVRALACKEQCVSVDAAGKLAVPIAASNEPAHIRAFEAAREALPPLLTEAPYLEDGGVAIVPARVGLNEPAALVATIRVKPGFHVQDRRPGVEGLIPTRLFVETPDGVEVADEAAQVWSTPRVHELPGFGRVREQAGTFTIRVPLKVTDADRPAGKIPLHVLLQYQCCSDEGQCFAPSWARAVATVDFDPAKPPSATPTTQPPAAPVEGATHDASNGGLPGAGRDTRESFAYVLLLAFLGGMILNIMPCVLPVISLKILGFVQQAGDDRARIFKMGLVYALGIGLSFVPIAALMAGASATWGSFMQSPTFLIILSAVVFAFGLSLTGVFEFQLPGFAMNVAGDAVQREGYGGALLSGIMTTALATPCTAPWLGSAVGVLTRFPPTAQFAGIMTVGAGLAFPYVLLSAFPGWLRFLPKPGHWMITFKEIVGFIMFGVVIWLLSNLSEQVEIDTLLGTLALLVVVAFACWLLGRITPSTPPRRAVATWLAAALTLVAGSYGSFRAFDKGWQQIPWQPWQPGLPTQLAAEGYTVYVDYTASWCLTCQANKRLVLETDTIRKRFDELNIVPIEGDFTRRDPRITAELRKYGRNGVPLNIILPAGRPDDPIILPAVLTRKIVLEALAQAGPSKKKPALAHR